MTYLIHSISIMNNASRWNQSLGSYQHFLHLNLVAEYILVYKRQIAVNMLKSVRYSTAA